MFRKLTIFFLIGFLYLFLAYFRSTNATGYSLVAPTGTLNRGDDVTFQLNIDTEGQSMSTANIGLTYKTEFLEYKSIASDNTFSSVDATPDGNGNLAITASESSGYNGSGTLANITFNLIAQSSGSTELCTLTSPTTPPGETIQPTKISSQSANPTNLPITGGTENGLYPIIFGSMFIFLAGALIWMNTREQKKLH